MSLPSHSARPDGSCHQRDTALPRLAGLLSGLPPSAGPVRLVGVDGYAGAGKSTFASRLADALGGAPVLRLDDLASHAAFFGWMERLSAQVLTPLERGLPARYGVYDWVRREYASEAVLPAAPVVLLEGVGAGRAALRPWLTCLLWMDVPAERAHGRGMRRDGPELADFWHSGSVRNALTSPQTRPLSTPTSWYVSAVPDMRYGGAGEVAVHAIGTHDRHSH